MRPVAFRYCFATGLALSFSSYLNAMGNTYERQDHNVVALLGVWELFG